MTEARKRRRKAAKAVKALNKRKHDERAKEIYVSNRMGRLDNEIRRIMKRRAHDEAHEKHLQENA